jgi:uncharacterized protein (DUF169 family)
MASPRDMLKLAQGSLFRLGGRVEGSCAGIQSVCSIAAALPYLSGKPNFSLGCDGSRKFSGIADDERVIGIPAGIPPHWINESNHVFRVLVVKVPRPDKETKLL